MGAAEIVLLIAALVRSDLIPDAIALIRAGFGEELTDEQQEAIIVAQNKLAARIANTT